MKPVIIESPFQGTSRWAVLRWFQRLSNARYARRALRDSLSRGEAPLASHLLYPQVLANEDDPAIRGFGIRAGLTWTPLAKALVVYADRGISSGMQQGIKTAEAANRPVEFRYLNKMENVK